MLALLCVCFYRYIIQLLGCVRLVLDLSWLMTDQTRDRTNVPSENRDDKNWLCEFLIVWQKWNGNVRPFILRAHAIYHLSKFCPLQNAQDWIWIDFLPANFVVFFYKITFFVNMNLEYWMSGPIGTSYILYTKYALDLSNIRCNCRRIGSKYFMNQIEPVFSGIIYQCNLWSNTRMVCSMLKNLQMMCFQNSKSGSEASLSRKQLKSVVEFYIYQQKRACHGKRALNKLFCNE